MKRETLVFTPIRKKHRIRKIRCGISQYTWTVFTVRMKTTTNQAKLKISLASVR